MEVSLTLEAAPLDVDMGLDLDMDMGVDTDMDLDNGYMDLDLALDMALYIASFREITKACIYRGISGTDSTFRQKA
jgi:hypothetical protein